MRTTMVVAIALLACGCKGKSAGESNSTGAAATTQVAQDAAAAPVEAAPTTHHADRSGPPPLDLAALRSRAFARLASQSTDAELFDDPYIRCVGSGSVCDPAYRALDYAVLVLMWLPESEEARRLLGPAKARSERIMEQWLTKWKDTKFEVSAIDLYALFPYYYPGPKTAHMLNEVVAAMNADGDWEPYTFHDHPYRKVTDELWTIAAIAANHVPKETMRVALDRKRAEGIRILSGDWKDWKSVYKYYALSHIYYAFLWTEQNDYDVSAYWPFLLDVEAWLAENVERDPELTRSTAALANALNVLAQAGYPDTKLLSKMTADLVARQHPAGGWRAHQIDVGLSLPGREYLFTPETKDIGWAHTTLMAISGLETWSKRSEYLAARMEREWMALVGPGTLSANAQAPTAASNAGSGQPKSRFEFAVTRPVDIVSINEYRANPENAVLFFQADDVRAEIKALLQAGAAPDSPEVHRLERIAAIVESVAEFRPSRRGIKGTKTDQGLVLEVELELHGPGASPAFAERVRNAVETTWRGEVDGKTVSTKVNVHLRAAGAAGAESDDWLPVFVPLEGASPYTRREGDYGDADTTWSAELDAKVIGHEMGHFFGFADEYRIEIRDGVYYVVYNSDLDLMGNPVGEIRPRYLAALIRYYGGDGDGR